MNIRKLQVFYSTAISLNMTKVARELYISQPSISQSIREVEEEVGANLFDRIGKRIYLTNEGEIFLNYTRRILNLYEEACDKVHETDKNKNGKIRIGASTTIGIYLLPDIIKKFVEVYDGVEISLIIENASIIEELILENKIDFAFVEGKVTSEEIIKDVIWNDELIFICSKKSELANKEEVNSDKIKGQKFIMREYGSGTREYVEGYLWENKVEYKIFMELGDTEAIKRCVEAGLGIGCISTLCMKENNNDESLHVFRLDKGNIERNLYLIRHKDKFINNNMKKFIEFANR